MKKCLLLAQIFPPKENHLPNSVEGDQKEPVESVQEANRGQHDHTVKKQACQVITPNLMQKYVCVKTIQFLRMRYNKIEGDDTNQWQCWDFYVQDLLLKPVQLFRMLRRQGGGKLVQVHDDD